MKNKNKNGNETNLIRYSVCLLVVAMVFIIIGGISLSRSINRGDDRIMRNFNVNDKVKEISNQNLELTQENSQLKKKLEAAEKENEALRTEKKNTENENEAYKIYIQACEVKETDSEKYSELMENIKNLEISDELKEKLTQQSDGEE